MLTVSKEVLINREKYYPYTLICPFCGAKLSFIKKTRTVMCEFCDFNDTAVERTKNIV